MLRALYLLEEITTSGFISNWVLVYSVIARVFFFKGSHFKREFQFLKQLRLLKNYCSP